jgi:alanyl-tRNA synthetase
MYEDISFESEIINRYERKGELIVELSFSSFYPDGAGGQLGDRGTINGVDVIGVKQDKMGVIQHIVLNAEQLSEGDKVLCRINGENRNDIAQQHTAQHLISANFDNDYGIHTVGFHMSENHTTIDLNSKDIDEDVIERIEKKTFNQIISLLAIDILEVSPKEIYKYPLRKELNDKLLGLDKLRLVKIGDLDYSLCKGFHCDNTGNLGIIKIFKMEKVKSGFTRIYYVAGKRALIDYQMSHKILKETTDFLSTSKDELQLRLRNLVDENKTVSKMSKKLSESLAQEMYQNLSGRNIDGKRRIVKVLPSEESAKGLSKQIMKEPDTIAVFLFEKSKSNGFNIISTHNNIDAKEILEQLKISINMQGGGNSNMTLGVVHGNLDKIKDEVEEIVNKY